MMALATRYEVSAQAASSTLAERLPAMCGSDMFTTALSSTSIKVPNFTAMAAIHGLTYRCVGAADGLLGWRDYLWLNPPSTAITCPVMKSEAFRK